MVSVGNGGEDTLTGTSGERVRAMYDLDPAGVAVNLGAGTATDGWGGNDTLVNIEAVSGSKFNDTVIGSNNADGFFATFGNDTIDGGASDRDWIDYSFLNGQSGFFKANVNLTTGVGEGLDSSDNILFTDTLTNVEDVYGSMQGDKIMGSSTDNRLFGNEGNDTLNGSSGGADILTGGPGNDVFEFMEFASPDMISDFTITGEPDKIRFMDTDMGLSADGTNSNAFATVGSPVNPTLFKTVGITDAAIGDWSALPLVATFINSRVSGAEMTDGNTDDTYFLVHNGTNTRIYYWDGDSNTDDLVNDTELKQMAELIAVNDLTSLSDAHFEFI